MLQRLRSASEAMLSFSEKVGLRVRHIKAISRQLESYTQDFKGGYEQAATNQAARTKHPSQNAAAIKINSSQVEKLATGHQSPVLWLCASYTASGPPK